LNVTSLIRFFLFNKYDTTIERGKRLVELLKQKQYSPMEAIDQSLSIYAATKGYFDTVPVTKISKAESDFLDFVKTKNADIYGKINSEKAISDTSEAALVELCKSFVATFKY